MLVRRFPSVGLSTKSIVRALLTLQRSTAECHKVPVSLMRRSVVLFVLGSEARVVDTSPRKTLQLQLKNRGLAEN
jgi:hypothetical protein